MSHATCLLITGAAAAAREDALAGDVLPASALGTASEDYYPTVAINALMRLLRDPSMASHQQAVTQALFEIFRTLGLGCVPYLPKVGPERQCSHSMTTTICSPFAGTVP